MNIGYIGLGEMGGALARRLQLRKPLLVFDLNAIALKNLAESGASPCASASELAAACDTIFLCLPTSEHVRTALFGENGIAQFLKPGALVIDQTSGDPVITRQIAEKLSKLQVTLVDAPVSGGPEGAQAGTIAIMVGAEESAFNRARPLLELISPNVLHAGGIGAGHVIKLINNLISGAQRLLSLEAISLAAKNGIDPAKACEILVNGNARNAFLEKYLRQHVLTGKLNFGFTLSLMHKDLRLACQLGNDSRVPMFFGNLTREMYQMCISEKGPEANVHACTLVMDRLAGTNLVPADNDLK
ncbi:6-phosphogluconate dehydrogenase [Caballeronia calidae]|uniref:6-phosphogluconate dehydrogenase n=2 Tax=Caballeronia calidae TaxID=1777139 RepID=A0A158DUV7_9BURK|nr:6-phosphogluconate dehydrogenase [Caballeronia calidae]